MHFRTIKRQAISNSGSYYLSYGTKVFIIKITSEMLIHEKDKRGPLSKISQELKRHSQLNSVNAVNTNLMLIRINNSTHYIHHKYCL